MKKQRIVLLVSILVSISFFSCQQKTIKTEEKSLSEKYYLTTDTSKGALKVDIQIELPVDFHKKEILDSVRNSIITNLFGEKYISTPNDSLVGKFANDLAIEYRLNNENMGDLLKSNTVYSFNNEHNLSGYGLLSDKKIYVYGIERYVFMGGVHGYQSRNYYNYDLKTGKQITEKDLFVDKYEKNLTQIIKDRLLEQAKEEKEPKNSEPVLTFEDTDFWTDSIKPNGNFYISDLGVNYVFNPYEIAPFYMGQTEVNIPFSRLNKLLKPDNTITYLIKKQSN